MIVIVLAKTRKEAQVSMKKLGKDYSPINAIRTTDDDVTDCCPANRLYMHTEYIDGMVQNGKIHGLYPHRYRDAYMEALKTGLKEFSFEIPDCNPAEDGV